MRIVVIVMLICRVLTAQVYNYKDYGFSEKWLSINESHGVSEELSYIGEYRKALDYRDQNEPEMPRLSKDDSIYFSDFKPVDALTYLSEIANGEKVIMINEAHHQPYHRVFTTQLLKILYDKGFRYFGVETLNHFDTLLNLRKYPVQYSGYYSKEPLYGNLIRTALDIGYTLFAYETTSHREDSAGVNFREIEQAKNIKKIVDKDPSAKMLIHCGYDHIVETDYPGWGKTMAGRFIEYTGINPFTIDQVKLTERSAPKYDNPFFKIMNLNYFALLVDSAGNLFNGQKGVNQYDVRLYHPKTEWLYGRPHWMFDDIRQPFFIHDSITISYPCLVFAYLAKEIPLMEKNGEAAIPFDIIELENRKDRKALSLKPGKYKIVVRDKKEKIQYIDLIF